MYLAALSCASVAGEEHQQRRKNKIAKPKNSENSKPVSSKFTKGDADGALREIFNIYGKKMAEDIEKMYRLETDHFRSKQYINTGSSGMEVGKWDTSYWKNNEADAPTGVWSAFENKGLSGAGGNKQVLDRKKDYYVFGSVNAAMKYLADYINRHNGNVGRWHSTDPKIQKAYEERLQTIIPRIVNTF